jgi:hypothetical protein
MSRANGEMQPRRAQYGQSTRCRESRARATTRDLKWSQGKRHRSQGLLRRLNEPCSANLRLSSGAQSKGDGREERTTAGLCGVLLLQSRKRIDRNTTIGIRFSLRSSGSLVEPVDWEELIRTRFTSHPRQLAQWRFFVNCPRRLPQPLGGHH